MDVRVSANRAGGGTSPVDRFYRSVGDLLTLRLGDYGASVRSVAISVYFQRRLRPGQTPSGAVITANAWLAKLPQTTFRKSERQLEVSAPSGAPESQGGRPAMEEVRQAAEDVASAVGSLRRGKRKYDDFDVVRFVADATEILSNLPETYAEIASMSDVAIAKRFAEFAALDPWDRLGVDWSKYAPNARAILDDPFYWDEANGLSPHGSDTGADVLRGFRVWNRRHPTDSPCEFVERTLTNWGISPIDWTIDDAERTQALRSAEPIRLRVCDETAIAATFAAIKVRGSCPLESIAQARRAVLRQQLVAASVPASDEVRKAGLRATELLLSALDAVAATTLEQ